MYVCMLVAAKVMKSLCNNLIEVQNCSRRVLGWGCFCLWSLSKWMDSPTGVGCWLAASVRRANIIRLYGTTAKDNNQIPESRWSIFLESIYGS